MSHELTAKDYVIRVHAEPGAIDAEAWNALAREMGMHVGGATRQ